MEDKIPVMNIIHDSVVDGVGIRSVLFVAGCPHHCKGCHNPQSWEAKNGTLMSIEEIYKELENPLTDVTFSGGEPMLYAKQLLPLARKLKEDGRSIWCYSGFTYEYLKNKKDCSELLDIIDVLVDGYFDLSLRDISLKFRGSSNQRILYLQEGEIIKIGVD